MAQTLSEGEVFNYTTTGAVANGQLLVINRMAGVALTSATGSGQKVALGLEGVYQLASAATGAKTQGLRAMYRTTGSQLKVTVASGTATGAKYSIGYIWETATATATSVKVRLHGGALGFI